MLQGWVPKFFGGPAAAGGLFSTLSITWMLMFDKKNKDHEVVKIYDARTFRFGWILARLKGEKMKKKKSQHLIQEARPVSPGTLISPPIGSGKLNNIE